MSAVPHLRVVTEDGEVLDECPGCKHREDVVAGLERDIRGWAARYQELKRDKDREARESDLWDDAERLFKLWRRATGRKRCRFSTDRFYLVEPFLRRDGFERCAQAVIGRAFEHYTVQRKNGTTKRFHEWERIFDSRGEFEESANRIPKDWRERLEKWDVAT